MKRYAALSLVLGLLVTAGGSSLGRCCTLEELSRTAAASIASPDCCDRPDCCRGEKRGPAQAALSAGASEAGSRWALAASGAAHAVISTGPLVAFSRLPLPRFDHAPPARGRDLHLLISLFRV